MPEAGEMTQLLRSLAVLPEDLGSIPSPNSAAHRQLFLTPADPTPSHRHTHAGETPRLIKK